MTRIYPHTITDAPEASRPLLEGIVPFSPTGKLLNMQTPMDLPAGSAAADEPE
jgi:hypothetical protein